MLTWSKTTSKLTTTDYIKVDGSGVGALSHGSEGEVEDEALAVPAPLRCHRPVITSSCQAQGPYGRHMPRVLGGSQGGGHFLIGEVPLFLAHICFRVHDLSLRPAHASKSDTGVPCS